MALIQPTLDYTDRDFESLRLRLQGVIRSVFPDWTDFNVASFGTILSEMFSFVGDTLHYYQDAQAAEAFWPTLNQRISAIRKGRIIGFELSGATSSTGTARFSVPAAVTSKVLIPEGTRLRTTDPENPVPFRTTAYAEISVGNSYVDVPVEQAEVRSQTYDSSEEPNQEIVLTSIPYLDNSASISATDGSYTEVDSFLGSLSTSRTYIILVDQFDKAHIRFGNGTTGAIPQGEINVSYKIGGGTQGNVEAGKLTILEDSLYDSGGATAPVSVTNLVATSGGADRMTLAEAKVQAPASLRVLTRTVTKMDFEDVAKSIRGVARALMATSNEWTAIPENYGHLYVIAQGAKLVSGRIVAATPSSALLQEIHDYIMNEKPPTITFQFETKAAILKNVNITTRVYLDQGYDGTTVGANIRASLQDFFAVQLETGVDNPDIDFGANLKDVDGTIVGEITWSDVFNAVRDTEGVRKVDEGLHGLIINGLRQSIVLNPAEFPILGTIGIVNVDTGGAI